MPTRTNNKNAKGGGTIRQRPDGRWEARYTVGRDPGTGKQIQRSVYGQTQAEVRKKLSQISTEMDNGVYKDPSKITVGEWLDIWLEEYNGNVKPFTINAYEKNIRIHIKPYIGAVKLAALTVPQVQRLYNGLSKGIDGHKALSPKSVKDIHGVLHKALKQATTVGYLRYNPADNCALPRIVRSEIKPFDDLQIPQFLTAIKGHKFENLYILALFTGMREGELLGLTWDCVDIIKQSITVCRQLQKGKNKGDPYAFTSLKNDKGRSITVSKPVIEALRSQFTWQLEARRVAGNLWSEGDFENLVFTNEFGKHLVAGTVYKNFKAIVTEMGLPDMRFHDLRHTFAVMSIRAGDDIKTVQENMGHHTAAFTLDVYGHVTEQMKKDSADRMEQYIQKITG